LFAGFQGSARTASNADRWKTNWIRVSHFPNCFRPELIPFFKPMLFVSPTTIHTPYHISDVADMDRAQDPDLSAQMQLLGLETTKWAASS
jgi:hypothetical protein